ncbi:polyprenyl synthetase family protein, partial [Staphylococcus haemolyticus]
MTKMSMNELIEQINNALDGVIKPSPLNTNLEESMQYSLNAGGKRIRPLLVFLTLDVLNQDYTKGKQTALALEMIHTYSLIHDDLPPMDNDDYRRGKLTNHKVYGEWKAILAGDALLTKAFEIVADDDLLEPEVKVKVLSRLAHNSGHLGMVGGQTLDMQSEDKPVDLETLEQIHKAKTGALLKFAILSAADIAKVDQSTS